MTVLISTLRRWSRSAALVCAFALSARRAPAQISVLSNIVDEHATLAGVRYTGAIVLSNPTDVPQVARLYQTDYSFSADGTSHFDDPSSGPRSNAAWVALQQSQIVIPPRRQAVVPYTVTPPASDSLRGSYWSVVMVEGAPADSAHQPSAQPSVGVSAVIRYAVQLATHIGGTGARAVRFTNAASALSATGVAAFDVDVTDSGERAYRPTLWIEVYDEAGMLKATRKQSRGLLYPGTSLRQHFDLGSLAKGTYKAMLFADTGTEAVFAKPLTLVF